MEIYVPRIRFGNLRVLSLQSDERPQTRRLKSHYSSRSKVSTEMGGQNENLLSDASLYTMNASFLKKENYFPSTVQRFEVIFFTLMIRIVKRCKKKFLSVLANRFCKIRNSSGHDVRKITFCYVFLKNITSVFYDMEVKIPKQARSVIF